MNEIKNNIPEVKANITWVNDKKDESLKAVASLTIADSFKVHGVRLVEGKTGLFVAMPQRKVVRDGEKAYVPTAYPVTSDMRQAVQDAVISAYEQRNSLTESSESEEKSEEPAELPEEVTEDEPEPVMSM